MNQAIGLVTLVVREYDEALDFYVTKLGFTLVEDSFVPEDPVLGAFPAQA